MFECTGNPIFHAIHITLKDVVMYPQLDRKYSPVLIVLNLVQVLAFSLFLTIQPLAFLVFILTHWLVLTICIAIKKTSFCPTKPLEYLFDGVIGYD